MKRFSFLLVALTTLLLGCATIAPRDSFATTVLVGDEIAISIPDRWTLSKKEKLVNGEKVLITDSKSVAHFIFTATAATAAKTKFATIDDWMTSTVMPNLLKWYAERGKYPYYVSSERGAEAAIGSGETMKVSAMGVIINGNWRNVQFGWFTRGDRWYWLFAFNQSQSASLEKDWKTILEGIKTTSTGN